MTGPAQRNITKMDTDMKLFLQFKKFMEMQKEISDTSSVSTSSQEQVVWRTVGFPVRKIDYTKVMNAIMSKMSPWVSDGECCSRNPGLFWVFKNLYMDFPDRFQVIGELHTSPDGTSTYFSFAYIREDKRVNFHAHGKTVGLKFRCTHIDIFLNSKEQYLAAAMFHSK